jgi:hypothetical protein
VDSFTEQVLPAAIGPSTAVLPLVPPVAIVMLWLVLTPLPRAVVAGVVVGGVHASVKLNVAACGKAIDTVLLICKLPLSSALVAVLVTLELPIVVTELGLKLGVAQA